jgi:hypothetical protein
MENNGIIFLITLLVILAVINIFTTREAATVPGLSIKSRVWFIILIWLLPIIGLYIVYPKLRLSMSSYRGGGYVGGEIDADDD